MELNEGREETPNVNSIAVDNPLSKESKSPLFKECTRFDKY